jgi:polysaccharide pyruvyl transferase WcaK-like protein
VKSVLIIGGQFGNQGAYLMLRAAADAVRTRLAAAPVVDARLGTAQQKAQAGVGSLSTPILRERSAPLPGLRRQVWSRARSLAPWVAPSDIDCVLDISGFRYGDQWEHLPLDRYAGYLGYWHGRGVPVYALPQAFGPFDRTAGAARTALAACRIVMPRDDESRRLLGSLHLPEQVSVQQFPDFTALVPGAVPWRARHLAGGVPIVANYNIADRSAGGAPEYVATLVAICRRLRELGLEPYGLLHGGRRDRDVLDAVAAAVGSMPLLDDMDGVEQKGLIGQAPVVVAGRFHAIVSALTQGVPVLIHGWSHKYSELARDFGIEHLIVPAVGDDPANRTALDAALGTEGLRAALLERAADVKQRAGRMWTTVLTDLGW